MRFPIHLFIYPSHEKNILYSDHYQKILSGIFTTHKYNINCNYHHYNTCNNHNLLTYLQDFNYTSEDHNSLWNVDLFFLSIGNNMEGIFEIIGWIFSYLFTTYIIFNMYCHCHINNMNKHIHIDLSEMFVDWIWYFNSPIFLSIDCILFSRIKMFVS